MHKHTKSSSNQNKFHLLTLNSVLTKKPTHTNNFPIHPSKTPNKLYNIQKYKHQSNLKNINHSSKITQTNSRSGTNTKESNTHCNTTNVNIINCSFHPSSIKTKKNISPIPILLSTEAKMIKLKLQKIDYINHKKTPLHNTTQANTNNVKTSHKIITLQRNRNYLQTNSKDQLPLITTNKSNNNIQQQSQFFTSNFLKVNNKEKKLSSSVKQIVAVKNNVVSGDNSREDNEQMNQDAIENSFINEIKDLLENGNEKKDNEDIKYYYKKDIKKINNNRPGTSWARVKIKLRTKSLSP